ncbi:hypothetical protein Tsubulata_045184 [Turnera subulata]|uniref:BHLH domain-containing protein n=1 Tax=Turnera subulata TaxID=218843 RepID=A0A9Q0FUS2_9ROSI|nr:hypothetical protein Tsubulata_045184 [Turnera subulata]
MQPVEAFPEGEWDFSRIFSMEEPDFSQELMLGQFSLPLEHEQQQHLAVFPPAFCPHLENNASIAGFNESLFFPWNTLNSNLNFISDQEMSNSTSSNPEACFFSDSNHVPAINDHHNSMSMDICTVGEKNAGSFFPVFPQEFAMVENGGNNGGSKMSDSDSKPTANAVLAKELELKRKNIDATEPTAAPGNMKKKSRVMKDAPKTKKNAQSKKNQKVSSPNGNEEEKISNGGPVDGQTTCSYCSEDDNASQDSNGGASSDSKVSEVLNSNGKTRAGRGSATDPQSLYARKRRERINERLRILQNLVPNGTKVDISTMLEEAVHYVKFLQLQIKLLSSDELWMYAPLAYNGIDIGLNQKISMLL